MRLIRLILFLMLSVISLISNAQNARQYYKAGLTFATGAHYQDAVDQFTKAINLDPEYAQAYSERARAYEAMGNLADAVTDLKRAITFEPNEAELYYHTARIYFTLNNLNEALDLINKSIALNRKSETYMRLRARIQMALEDYSGSLSSINRALALKNNAENNFYHGQLSEKMKNFSQAETDYTNTIEKNPQYSEAIMALATLQLQLNKLSDALNNCNAFLTTDPGNRQGLLIRSRVYAKRTEYPKAIDDISTILHRNPDDTVMYVIRGTYYQEFTQQQEAIRDFTKALLYNPKNAEALFKRAASYEQTGDFKSAIKDYETLTSLSLTDPASLQQLKQAKTRLFELNREKNPPTITLLAPTASPDSSLKIPRNLEIMMIKGIVADESNIGQVTINKKPVAVHKTDDHYTFAAEIDLKVTDYLIITARDIYDNATSCTYSITRTEVDPPVITLQAPYASDNGEIYLETDKSNLYIEGTIRDESPIKSILIDSVTASYALNEINPRFSATINIANKNKFRVTATDLYGNDTTLTFMLNREGISSVESNPMGRTWVILIENSNYETFPSLDGPAKDIALMRSALEKYDIHNIIYKQDMTKKEMERFFSIDLRDLLRSNNVNALMIWYAGHGEFINETGYWVPVDANRNDEFSYYNLNALRASLQSYSSCITHSLIITDACQTGPAFYEALRETPKELNCNDQKSSKLRSSQVFSSAGYESASDNSLFTKTFSETLTANSDYCLPIESIAEKVTQTVTRKSNQKPVFGKISGLHDEGGTFFFIISH
jgi:tetratricopeptide (TPR) repeat protein